MIARSWHGAVPGHLAGAYGDFLRAVALPDYRATPGNRSVLALRRNAGQVTHFQLLSLWDSLDAIRAFAGDDVERARYYPQDPRYLLDMEPTVTHHEVVKTLTAGLVVGPPAAG